MGGREVGGLANLLSAHRDLANPAHRAEGGALWGVDSVPGSPGKTAVELFRPAPARSRRSGSPAPTRRSRCPIRPLVREALQAAEFVVLQEAYANTETAAFADLLLPATAGARRTAR
jgi:assimilatory nitrate reductase catalytic subunit